MLVKLVDHSLSWEYSPDKIIRGRNWGEKTCRCHSHVIVSEARSRLDVTLFHQFARGAHQSLYMICFGLSGNGGGFNDFDITAWGP